MDFVDLWRCGRIRCLHLIQELRFRVLGSSFSSFGCFVFDIWVLRFRSRVLRFRVLGASFSRFGCFVFEIWVLRFRDLGASCFGLRFRVLRFRNYHITSGIYAKYHVQIMLLFVYTTTRKRFVIFTCRYFKLS